MLRGGLPTFERRVQIRPTGVQDVSFGFRKLSGALQEFARGQLRNAEGALIQEAKRRGIQAGTNLGFKPQQPVTKVGQVFEATAEAANRQYLRTTIGQAYQGFKNEAIDMPDAQAGQQWFNQKSQEYAKSILNTVDPGNTKFATNFLNYFHTEGNLAIQRKVNAQTKRLNEADNLIAGTNALSNMQIALRQSNVPAAKTFLAQADQVNKVSLINGQISPQQFAKSSIENQKLYVKSLIGSMYSNLLNQGDVKGALKLQNQIQQQDVPDLVKQIEGTEAQQTQRSYIASILPSFNSVDKQDLLNELNRIRNQRIQTLGLNSSGIRQQMKNNLVNVANGGQSNVKVESDAFLIGEGKQYQQQLADTKTIHSAVETAGSLPLNQQLGYVQTFKPTDPNQPDFARQLGVYNDILKQTQQNQQMLIGPKADPFALSMTNPGVQKAFQAWGDTSDVNAVMPNFRNNSVNQNIKNPYDVSVQWQAAHGLLPSQYKVIGNADAKVKVMMLENADPDQQIQMLDAAKLKYGKYYPVFLRNLQQQGLSPNVNFLSAYSKNDPNLPMVSVAIKTPLKVLKSDTDKENVKLLDNDIDQVFSPEGNNNTPRFNQYLNSVKGFNAPERAQFIHHIRGFITSLAYTMMINKNLTPSAALTAATNSLVKDFQFTALEGHVIRTPSNINPNIIAAVANAKKESELKNFNFIVPPSQNVEVGNSRRDIFNNVIKPGHWVTNQANTGLVYVDINGNPVRNEQGQTFNLSFQDALHNNIARSGFLSNIKALQTLETNLVHNTLKEQVFSPATAVIQRAAEQVEG